MHQGAVARFRLAEALQLAVATGQISLVFQPIVDLRSGAVAGTIGWAGATGATRA